jgi:hypothetical protein
MRFLPRPLAWLWERLRGDRVTFECGKRSHVVTPSRADFLAAAVLHEEPFSPMLGGSGKHPRESIVRAAEKYLDAVRRDFELLRFEYGFEGDTVVPGLPLGRLRATGPMAMVAVEVGGRRYSLQGGVGQCALVKMATGAGGMPVIRQVGDLRLEKSIDTDQHGTITIARREKNLRLLEEMEALVRFLGECDGQTVSVRVSWNEGGTLDDWS